MRISGDEYVVLGLVRLWYARSVGVRTAGVVSGADIVVVDSCNKHLTWGMFSAGCELLSVWWA